MEKSLCEKLQEYSAGHPLRMHMPGHKGNGSCVEGAQFDITEISGFDNLHGAEGILFRSMQIASKLWGSFCSYYLVNGSTCGILAGIRTLTNRGDKVLIARNCHKSVYHALELCGLTAMFLMPTVIEHWQIFGSVTPGSVEQALKENPDIKLVVITSPTYEGIISDIENIARIVHSCGAKLLVDEAHGAHLGLDSYFEQSSVMHGADIVVQSLHKTLDCPTQTAILHASDNVNHMRLSHQLSVFETSSPSYLFLSAMDKFVRNVYYGKDIFSQWTSALEEFYTRTAGLSNIEILSHITNVIPGIFAYDKSKIIFRCEDNIRLAAHLSDKYNIEFEAVSPEYITAMTGMGDNSGTLGAFADILLSEDSQVKKSSGNPRAFIYSKPSIALKAEAAQEAAQTLLSVDEASGEICGEYVWEYPPGIPLMIPGEIIPDTFAETVKNDIYGRICSQYGRLPKKISTADISGTMQEQLSEEQLH